MSKTAWVGMVLLGSTGCVGHIAKSEADFSDVRVPVLIGPVDHVNGAGKPLRAEKVGEYDAAAKGFMSNKAGYDYENNDEVTANAIKATNGKGDVDIRMTEINPTAVGVLVAIKSRVYLEGEVVKVSK